MASPGQGRRSGGSTFSSPSRLHEKRDLAELNDRLAAYIDVVRNLRPDQTDHQSLIQGITEDLKRTYEVKLADAYAEREQEARKRGHLQVELERIREELTELGDSNNRTKAELDAALTRQRELEALLNTKDVTLNAAVGEKRALEADMRNLKDDLTKLNENSFQLKRKLQEETLRKLEAESSLQTLKDKLEFLMNSHAEEKKHLQERYDELLAKSSQSGQGYEGRYGTTMADFRAQFEEKLNFYKENSEKNYESKLEVIRRELQRFKQQVEDLTVERQENRDKIKDLSIQVIDQQNQIIDLEGKLAREQDLNHEKEREMARLKAELQHKVDERQNPHVNDGDLSMELNTYREMLDGEERRLNLPPSPPRPTESTPRSDPGTTSRQLFRQTTPRSGRGGRRPRTRDPGTPRSQGSPVKKIKINQKASACGRIIVEEIDMNGKFVRLKNMSDEDQPLTNWCLKGQVGILTPTEYKFPRGFILKAEQTVTIWAASAGTTQNLPTDLVYQGLNTWGTGDRQFSLINADGEEMANRTVTCTEEFHGYAADDAAAADDDGDGDDGVSYSSERNIERTYNLRNRPLPSDNSQ